MKHVKTLAVVSALVVVGLSGCTDPNAPNKPSTISALPTVPAVPVAPLSNVTKVDTLEGKLGGMVALPALKDISGSTGYAWSYKLSDSTVTNVVKNEVKAPAQPKDKPVMVGVPSQRFITLKGLKVGVTTIKLELKRPWEKGVAAGDSLVYVVRIK